MNYVANGTGDEGHLKHPLLVLPTMSHGFKISGKSHPKWLLLSRYSVADSAYLFAEPFCERTKQC